ncbi:MAG: CBS domain-containing protein [Halobacteriaceae archaeon]
MPVKHLAVDPVTGDPAESVAAIVETMARENVGDVIIEDRQEPVGIVTDRDVALAYARRDEPLDDLEAQDLMTEDPATIHGDAEAVDLPRKMAEARVRRLPVVDDDGKLIGVATLDDVVATAGEQLEDVATVIESQSPDYSPD